MLIEMQGYTSVPTSPDGPPTPSEISFNTFSPAYESRSTMRFADGTSARTRSVAVLPQGGSQAYVFELACPSISCASAEEEFDRLLLTVSFAAGR